MTVRHRQASENVADVGVPGSAVPGVNRWFKTVLNASECIAGVTTTAPQVIRNVGTARDTKTLLPVQHPTSLVGSSSAIGACQRVLEGCWPVRSDSTKCRVCEGRQQQLLMQAGCTSKDIAAYCDSSGSATTCVGYKVSAAGSAEVNGCYVLADKPYEGRPTYFLTKDGGQMFQLYQYMGTWKIAHAGPKNVSYHATFQSEWPPMSPGGCGVWGADIYGRGPCPAVSRIGLPPTPPVPPPPPPPPVPPAPPAPPMHLVFEDNFDGTTINTSTLYPPRLRHLSFSSLCALLLVCVLRDKYAS